MFAAARSKRTIFAPPRQPSPLRRRFFSAIATVSVIAFATWGGVLIAEGLAGKGRTNNSITRWINIQVDALLAINPILAGVVGALAIFVCLAWFIRDHN
jgi:formate hydrogenlyase subunit 3/multisubunit Na+/H+ antiporter MnhD subunit